MAIPGAPNQRASEQEATPLNFRRRGHRFRGRGHRFRGSPQKYPEEPPLPFTFGAKGDRIKQMNPMGINGIKLRPPLDHVSIYSLLIAYVSILKGSSKFARVRSPPLRFLRKPQLYQISRATAGSMAVF
jgi:hypothetical protein